MRQSPGSQLMAKVLSCQLSDRKWYIIPDFRGREREASLSKAAVKSQTTCTTALRDVNIQFYGWLPIIFGKLPNSAYITIAENFDNKLRR